MCLKPSSIEENYREVRWLAFSAPVTVRPGA